MVIGAAVELWVTDLHAPDATALTDEERAQARDVRSLEVRRRFVASRSLLRTVLAAELGCRPREVPVVRPARGKPVLGCAGPRFNLSHADGLVVVAIAAGVDVGVDVERLRQLERVDALASRVLSDEESPAFRAASDPSADLLARWTVKEAVLKGIGDGLAIEPASVVAGGRDPRPVRIGGAPSPWTVRNVIPAPGYVGAVAVRHARFTVRLRTWPPGSDRGRAASFDRIDARTGGAPR